MKYYKLITQDDKNIKFKAQNKLKALNKARAKGFKVKEIYEFDTKLTKLKALKIQKLILVFKELSLLLEVGLSLQVASEKFYENAVDKDVKAFLSSLNHSLLSGLSLSLAFENCGLEKSDIALIKIGENTGKLPFILANLANLKERNLKNVKNIKKALLYPSFVFCVLIFAVCALILFVLPSFEQIFLELNVALPFITRLMLGIYAFLREFYPLLLLVFCGVMMFFAFLYRTNLHFKRLTHHLALKLPLLSKLILYSEFAKFFSLFSLLLQSGIDTLKAFDLAKESLSNEILYQKMTKIANFCKAGLSLDRAFKELKLHDNIVLSMLSTAMLSAKLSLMSEKIGLYYETKQKDVSDTLIALLEPTMTLLVALLVLLLALGIFLPMWDLNTAIRF